MEIKGRGIGEYRTAFYSGRIKPGDNLFIHANSLEHYIVMEEEKLDWGDSFNRIKAEQFTTSQILSKKHWLVKVK